MPHMVAIHEATESTRTVQRTSQPLRHWSGSLQIAGITRPGMESITPRHFRSSETAASLAQAS